MIKIILSIIGLAALIYFHFDISLICLKLHVSYTLSNVIPYALEFMAICMLIFHTYTNYLKKLPYVLSRIIILIILAAGCGTAIYFHQGIMYQGYFSHTYRHMYLKGESSTIFKQGLTMVALPGCPYCHARFGEMEEMSKIYPKLPMYVLVTHHDTTEVNAYRKAAKDLNIQVDFFPNDDLLGSVLIHGFPNLYFKKDIDSMGVINWSNDGFGSAAWDFVIDQEGL